MIKGLLFALGFVLLAIAIVVLIYFCVKASKNDDKFIEKRTRELTNKYKRELDDYSYSHNQAETNIEAKRLQKLLDTELAKLKDSSAAKQGTGILVSAIAALVCLGFIICIPKSFHQVDVGTYAVVKELGKITDVRTPGTHFDFHMTKEYQTYDATVQQVRLFTEAYSKDGQTMELEVYLQYQIQLDKLIIRDENGVIIQTDGIAGKYGNLESLQARIKTQCIEKTKAVMSSAEAMEIIQNRAIYSTQVSQTVRDAIGPDYYVNVQDVVLTDISFTDEFEKSVEAKVVAEQEKQAAETKARAEAEVARIKAENEKAVAEIEAQKKKIEAEADAEVIRIAANAQAKAAVQKTVELARTVGFTVTETETGYRINFDDIYTEEMFKELVQEYLEYLAYLDKWSGDLPNVVAGDNGVSIIVPNN